MKLGPRQVQFRRGFVPSRRDVRFAKRRNRLDLQETALVAEGEVVRFRFLGVERLFERALSEWTMVTVPYGRIEQCRQNRRWVVRAVLALLMLGCAGVAPQSRPVAAIVLVSGLAGLCALTLLWFVRPYYVLRFRARDGKVRVLRFWVQRRLRKEFAATLAAHREAAARYAVPQAWPAPAGR